MKEMIKPVMNIKGVPMKKTLFLVVLTTVFVLAFSAVAMAAGSAPANRTSSFLTKNGTDEGDGTMSYVSWSRAKGVMTTVGLPSTAFVTAHGGYQTTTVKCQVCHSAHKAAPTGVKLLGSNGACNACHLGANAVTDLKVSEGNRHGGTTQCTNGYCHAIAPHGVGDISKYPALKSAMLHNRSDSLIDAAIASGSTGAPVKGDVYTSSVDPVDGEYHVIGQLAVYNPGVTSAIMNDVSTAGAVATGRAIATGYICASGGCHMNGNFNSMTANATLGAWETTMTTTAFTGIDGQAYAAGDYVNGSAGWAAKPMRNNAIKGHTLAAVADMSVRGVAFANVGTCKACHDSIDYRISSTAKQFPHGNTKVEADGTVPATNNTTAAWFTLKSSATSDTVVITNKRQPTAPGQYTSGMDGACLKCHRGSDTTGVGFDF